jgi:type II secretory ATPase GspE/PulE/Tfp pilus assembly ATPase PilB-like protein
LGFDPADVQSLRHTLRAPLGLVLAVGPQRSGLSTTLAALRAALPDNAALATDAGPGLVFLDPAPSPAAARRAIAAIPAGCRVFSTLALERAAHVFGHYRALGLPPALLARDLLLVVAQRRVARLCPACRQPDRSADLRHTLALATNSWLSGISVAACTPHPGGCGGCAGSGHAGHALVYECLVVDSGVRALAEQGSVGLELEQALFAGGRSLWDHGLRLVARGVCSLTALRAVVREPC